MQRLVLAVPDCTGKQCGYEITYYEDRQVIDYIYFLAEEALRKAKFIGARRYSLDSCLSCFRQLFAQGQSLTYDLTDIGEYFPQYQRAMDHWHEVLPGRLLGTVGLPGDDWQTNGRGLVLDSECSGFRSLWELDLNGNWSLLGARDAQSPTLAGEQLVFMVTQFDANIWLLDPETGSVSDQALISSTKYDSHPSWSPDGQQIAFTSNRTGRGAIWVTEADGTRERLVFEPQDGRLVWPNWSPDGTHLIATRYDKSGQNLVRIALNQRRAEVIPTSGERPYGGTYSTDGRWLYYVASTDEQGTRLWRQATSRNAEAHRLTDQPINNFRLVPGGRILYTKLGLSHLYRASIDAPDNEVVLVEGLPSHAWADWTTMDDRVYFPGTMDSDTVMLVRMPLDGGEKEKVSDFYPNALGPNLAINPNTGAILATRTDRVQSNLFLVGLDRD